MLYDETLAACLHSEDTTHPHLLTAQNDLGIGYNMLEQLEKSVMVFELCLAGYTEVYGADHHQTRNVRDNLALSCEEAGHTDQAIDLYETNLAHCERLFGIDHPKSATARGKLSACRQKSDDATPK
ncbi:hypothetical protein A5667_27330 [Mycolicibacterium fortuitum]|nr:tetratricopeptide repeat protein [Mycolicibacterium fortuitum]OBI65103.1 hypothetical protein A5667_27330 [Mycolicibacterium fortuitum]